MNFFFVPRNGSQVVTTGLRRDFGEGLYDGGGGRRKEWPVSLSILLILKKQFQAPKL